MDSDGDGRSNGQELGDPDCIWEASTDEDPPLFPSVSHPGIVDEPVEDLDAIKSSCSDYQEPERSITYDMMLTEPASISEERTHYVCQQIEMPVPSAESLHMIKHKALIDNRDILHHMFVFFCFDGVANTNEGDRLGDAPYVCDGAESSCTQVATWAVGPEEECLPPTIGKKFDFTGMDKVIVKIEAHYDNTVGIPQQDQSGIQITFTPDLRPLTSGLSSWGMDVINKDFVIPPKQEDFALQSICPPEATSRLQSPIYVFQFYPHMHLSGKTMITEHYRCGKKIGTVGHIAPYEFDNQQQFRLTPAVKILPGDALLTTCTFDTTNLNNTITSGLGTDDEMCLGIMSYYPKNVDSGGLLEACFSFENGIALDRLDSMVPVGGDGGGAAAPNPALLDGRWALISSAPMEGIMMDFSSDPTTSWNPCCDTDTCDTAYLAAKAEACALNEDCSDGLFCNGGTCAVRDETANEGEDQENNEPKEGSEGVDWSRGIVRGVVLAMLGIVMI